MRKVMIILIIVCFVFSGCGDKNQGLKYSKRDFDLVLYSNSINGTIFSLEKYEDLVPIKEVYRLNKKDPLFLHWIVWESM